MGQRFRWYILETAAGQFDVAKETKVEATCLSGREVSDYLYQYGNPIDVVILTSVKGEKITWPSLAEYLSDDVDAERYGYAPSNADIPGGIYDV